MLVRFAGTTRSLSSAELEFVGNAQQLQLTERRVYDVQAVSVYKGVSFVLLYRDDGMTGFCPRGLFEMIDGNVPNDWICTLFAVGEVQLVLGPDIVAGGLEAYAAIVDQRSGPLENLWQLRQKRGPGDRFGHAHFATASLADTTVLADALATRLTATFDARRFRESIPLLIEGLRRLGHDLWNFDEGQDDQERGPWNPTFQTVSGQGLRVTFDDRVVRVTWNPSPPHG